MTDQTPAARLTLEAQPQPNGSRVLGPLVLTPPVGEDYWSHRVRLTDRQSLIAFPKFFTVGIGFALEDGDWNCNLPFTCDAEEIYEHIKHNRGDDAITREDCVAAIRLLQEAVRAERAGEVTR